MLKRIAIYLSEMFPITSFIGTMLTAFAFQLIYLRLFSLPPQFHIQMLMSGFVITGVTLLIRIMDEFKDFEDDLRNFPDRPLPSGKVLKSDLKFLATLCVATILIPSLLNKNLFIFSLLTLGFTLLMLKWFFIENKMRKSLPLAFFTHHPIVIFNIIYLLLGMIETYSELDWSKAFFILPLALVFTNWEIARKIRSPEGETAYTTYSKIWGPRKAISVSIVLQLIYGFTAICIFNQLGSPILLNIMFLVFMFLMLLPFLRFLFTLKIKTPFKSIAENQILLVIGFLIVACFL